MATAVKTRSAAARTTQRKPTMESVWAGFEELQKMFRETDRMFQETRQQFKETDRQFKETDRKIEESFQQSKALINDAANQMLGRFSTKLGLVIETLVTPNLTKKFQELGYNFNTYARNKVYKSDDLRIPIAEVDVFLENGDYTMAVEVKTVLGAEDINEHLHRMDVLREYADKHDDKRKYLGAVASPKVDETVRKAAHRAGFFVIEPSEDAVNIVVPEGFKPRVW